MDQKKWFIIIQIAEFVVIHNGILTNYKDVKALLVSKNYLTFLSVLTISFIYHRLIKDTDLNLKLTPKQSLNCSIISMK